MWIQRTSNLLWSKFTLDSAWWEIYASGADSSSWEGVCLHSTLLNGTGVVLGLAPALEYTFLKHVSLVGAYFKVLCPSIVDHLLDILCHPGSFFFCTLHLDTHRWSYDVILSLFIKIIWRCLCSDHILIYLLQGGLAPIDLKVDTFFHCAAPGGTGAAKVLLIMPLWVFCFCIHLSSKCSSKYVDTVPWTWTSNIIFTYLELGNMKSLCRPI